MGKLQFQKVKGFEQLPDNVETLNKITEINGTVQFNEVPLAQETDITTLNEELTSHTHINGYSDVFNASNFVGTTLTIDADVHNQGTAPFVVVMELDGTDYKMTSGAWKVSASGDVTVDAVTPFEGRIFIMKVESGLPRIERPVMVPIAVTKDFLTGVYPYVMPYTATEGNLLIMMINSEKLDIMDVLSSNWTKIAESNAGNGSCQAFYYKIATGTETDVSMESQVANAQTTVNILEYSKDDFDLSNPIVVANSISYTDGGQQSWDSVTTVLSDYEASMVTAIGCDSRVNIDDGRTWNNDYIENSSLTNDPSGIYSPIYSAERYGAVGDDVSTTYSTTDVGDEISLGIIGLGYKRDDYEEAVDDKQVLVGIADFGAGTTGEEDVATLIKSHNVDAIIGAGDVCYDGRWVDFQNRVLPTKYYGDFIRQDLFTTRMWPALGNHDYYNYATNGNSLVGDWFYNEVDAEAFVLPTNGDGTGRWYSKRIGNVLLITLDSAGIHNGLNNDKVAQKAFYDAECANTDATFIVVQFHHPPYSYGNYTGSSEMTDAYWDWSKPDLILNGHDHNAQHYFIHGTDICVIGHGGRSRYLLDNPAGPIPELVYGSDDHFGALFMTVENKVMTCEFKDTTSSVRHTFTIDKS